jgi:hypothetical protein
MMNITGEHENLTGERDVNFPDRSCPNFGSSLCGLCVSVPLWLIIAQESSPQRHRETKVAQRRIQIRTPLPGLVRYIQRGEQSGTEYRSEGEVL